MLEMRVEILRGVAWRTMQTSERCGYNRVMDVTSNRLEVGIRELKNGLSRYVDIVRSGREVIVTDRGRPVAKMTAIDNVDSRLEDLVAAGLVKRPTNKARHLPSRRIAASGPVSDLVEKERRHR